MSYTNMSPSAVPSSWLVIAAILLSLAAVLKQADTTYASNRESTDELYQTLAAPTPQETDEGSGPESKLPYLFAVYTIVWAGFFGYVFYMSVRQRETQRELDALKRELIDREKMPAEREAE